MLFTDLQNSVVSRLSGDAYFTKSPSVVVIPEDKNYEKQLNELLNSVGAAVVVSQIDDIVKGASKKEGSCPIVVAAYENPKVNRATGGTGRHSEDIAASAWALLQGKDWTPGKFWSEFEFESLIKSDYTASVDVWYLKGKVSTLIDRLITLIAAPNGKAMEGNDSKSVSVSP